MACRLSYIISVYNGEKYISRCLGSVFSLPLSAEELEVIVVDDCSTDNTLQLLNEYASKYSNMVVLHQEQNRRQGAARNRGIEIAKGEYIAFADADDEIVSEGVMNALDAMGESGVNVCYFDYEYECHQRWNIGRMPEMCKNTVMLMSSYLDNYYNCGWNAAWRTLYRTAFLRETGIRFVEGVRWEDCDWTVKVYSKAKEIQFVDGVGYRYAQNDTNTCSQAATPKGYAEQIYAGARLWTFAEEIESSLSGLAKTLKNEAGMRYVHQILRFRNFVKYSPKFWIQVFANIPHEAKLLLRTKKLMKWDKMVLFMPKLSICVSFVVYPLAAIGINFVRKYRN